MSSVRVRFSPFPVGPFSCWSSLSGVCSLRTRAAAASARLASTEQSTPCALVDHHGVAKCCSCCRSKQVARKKQQQSKWAHDVFLNLHYHSITSHSFIWLNLPVSHENIDAIYYHLLIDWLIVIEGLTMIHKIDSWVTKIIGEFSRPWLSTCFFLRCGYLLSSGFADSRAGAFRASIDAPLKRKAQKHMWKTFIWYLHKLQYVCM